MPKKKLKKEEKEEHIEKRMQEVLFSFKHLQTSISYKNTKDGRFFVDFLERLKKLSELGWEEIRKSQRHGFGTEKIPIRAIRPQCPSFVTPDVKELVVFRATGENKVFIGIQQENIFHIIFIEANFGDVYAH